MTARNGNRRIQIFRNYGYAQQILHNIAIILVKGHKGTGDADKALLPAQPLLFQAPGADGIHGEECGPAAVPAFEHGDGILAVLFPLHND